MGPQLEELDRGYEELERRRKEAEERDRTLSGERDELEGRYKELVDRERAVKVGAADRSLVWHGTGVCAVLVGALNGLRALMSNVLWCCVLGVGGFGGGVAHASGWGRGQAGTSGHAQGTRGAA